ncbi:hypothetical protein CcCBS67573_g02508 [Chytriomyces confervae]|uniref:Tc1-like transposase DDE domain-containing protein n=1 Tax=Chytriomyces confervae TaxID=246404 RepID=A0A507FKJ2_9FUNG|nr:hypothetical protein CcCBS67573_g02508 [Chytriomyces confervae]
MNILGAVSGHAEPQVKAYCMYMHFYLGLSKAKLAVLFRKAPSCIADWIAAYKRGNDMSRKVKEVTHRKFGIERRKWLVDLTSVSSFASLGSHGKVLERRAIQINQEDVIQFANDLAVTPFLLESLVFLDEVSFDNRVRGEKLYFRGEFTRKPRVSLLCWIGVNGLLEASMTEGTFDCTKFACYYKEFCTSSGHVYQYPGPHSVHILDGAKIHCSAELICFLRDLGIIPIFLPTYSPFFNPIEIVFGLVKKLLQCQYVENSKRDLAEFILDVLQMYTNRSFHKIFASCGYSVSGFNPGVAFNVPLAEFGFDPQETSQ